MSSTEKTHRVEVEILGQRLAIRSEAPSEYVRKLAAHVEKTMRQLAPEGGAKDPAKLALLTALAITDEMFRARDDRSMLEGEAAKRVGALLQLLDAVVPPSSHSS